MWKREVAQAESTDIVLFPLAYESTEQSTAAERWSLSLLRIKLQPDLITASVAGE
jgi:hypothetical protein